MAVYLFNNYEWPSINFDMNSDSLRFIYYDRTDVVHSNQISPRIEIREVVYTRW